MNAWRVRRPGPMDTQPLERVTVEVPRPGPGELLVAVRACGVCRTDLHVTEGDLPVHRPGVIPGHEVVGEVDRNRSAMTGDEFAVGDRVGIAWLRHTCGQCKFCVRGHENLCPESRYTGWDADGGYAEFATVPATYAHHLPTGYSDTELAPLLMRRASSAIAHCCVPISPRVGGWVSTDSAEVRTSPRRWRALRAPRSMS